MCGLIRVRPTHSRSLRRLTSVKGSAPRIEVSGERIDTPSVLDCDVCLSGLLQTISLELPRRPLPAGGVVCATEGRQTNSKKSQPGRGEGKRVSPHGQFR